ncbi:SpoVT/AbrB domain protein [Denitrovibrio acetiphilus DSM 12809]|uniref:SpoVT/AbrB domain protein n=1 Tax=Denitrovibrio acetiphilus (strain DSM 12809 / NBRC 114555 / N2460) TaxID=522772 RepID=D4H428_DENA2|nr:AbrB/MazE/SpoVT family DNA-binding domain-containing protein [Denitrovibrio acetiphilus]ADD67339.1 SpoVT/AbrB domain protein [Denitrovibrio acetiphilus DSM 12809]
MDKARVFKSGNSQAVRLPKEYQLNTNEVYIRKVGNMIILLPKADIWSNFEKSLDMFDDSFMSDRQQPDYDDRESF